MLTRKPTLAETKSRSCEAAAVMAGESAIPVRMTKRRQSEIRPMHETMVICSPLLREEGFGSPEEDEAPPEMEGCGSEEREKPSWACA